MVVCAVMEGRGSRGTLLRISDVGEDTTSVDAEWEVRGALVVLKLTQPDRLMGAQITWFGVIAGVGVGAGDWSSGETIQCENLEVKDEVGCHF